MNIDFEKTTKILSRGLTALVSLRALFRSGVSIKKLLNTSKSNPETKILTPPKDDRKTKQLHGALMALGYTRPEVDRTVKELSERIETEESLSDLVRASLVLLKK